MPTTPAGKEPQPAQKPSKERYVAMDRRQELVSSIKAQNPTTASAYTDDEIIDAYLTQFPEKKDFYKLPLPEDEQAIVDYVRQTTPNAEQYTDEELVMLFRHQQKANPELQIPNQLPDSALK